MYQSSGNAQNLAFQFQSYNPNGIMFHSTLGNEVATAYSGGTAIVLPEASFAMIPWIPKINRIGQGDYESFNGGFGTMADDSGLPLTYAVRGWAQKADASARRRYSTGYSYRYGVFCRYCFQCCTYER
jgi:hypothetical protein